MAMKVLVTGGAGCIGSTLAKRLLKDGYDTTIFDNLSSGKEEHIEEFMGNSNFRFIRGDLTDKRQITLACKNIDIVFHLAANSDIKYIDGDQTDEDLKLNTIATYNLLDGMRLNSVKKIVFTSSSAVYGEAKKMPTPEDYPLLPISLYGASKAACEALICGFCHMFGMQAWIVRFANIVGDKSRKVGKTVLSDFIDKLHKNPKELEILGDGKQSKCYLTAEDCIEGMLFILGKSGERVNIYNIGPEDAVTVNDIARIVADEIGLKNVNFRYTGGDRGWTGDVPRFMLDITKIKRLGWAPRHSSEEAIRNATRSLLNM